MKLNMYVPDNVFAIITAPQCVCGCRNFRRPPNASVGLAHEATRKCVLSLFLTSKSTAPTRLTAAKS